MVKELELQIKRKASYGSYVVQSREGTRAVDLLSRNRGENSSVITTTQRVVSKESALY